VSHTQFDITMTCHAGSSLLDPTVSLKNIPLNEVLSFKVAPLLGGGNSIGAHRTPCMQDQSSYDLIRGEYGPLPHIMPVKNHCSSSCHALFSHVAHGHCPASEFFVPELLDQRECGPLPLKLPTGDVRDGECGPLPPKVPSSDFM